MAKGNGRGKEKVKAKEKDNGRHPRVRLAQEERARDFRASVGYAGNSGTRPKTAPRKEQEKEPKDRKEGLPEKAQDSKVHVGFAVKQVTCRKIARKRQEEAFGQ